MGRRLLILSCSQRKRTAADLLPALERYDGPPFRVLRKFLSQCPLEIRNLDVYILSAEFGLIPSSRMIPCYDRKMTFRRAVELHSSVIAELVRILQGSHYEELFISIGRAYLHTIEGYQENVASGLRVTIAEGSQGRKLTMLRDWLGHGVLLHSLHDRAVIKDIGRARIRGIDVMLTQEEAFVIARRALRERQGNPTRYESWYVLVDDQRVSSKWLVSQLTGLSVNRFSTDEARRVLWQLGIESKRI